MQLNKVIGWLVSRDKVGYAVDKKGKETFTDKIILNNAVFYVVDANGTNLKKRLFHIAMQYAATLNLDDDGARIHLKDRLKQFDVSKDKEFGKWWTFQVTKTSKKILETAFHKYEKQWGDFDWSAQGRNFRIHCDVEEEGWIDSGPMGNIAVGGVYTIEAQGVALKKIRQIFSRMKIAKPNLIQRFLFSSVKNKKTFFKERP